MDSRYARRDGVTELEQHARAGDIRRSVTTMDKARALLQAHPDRLVKVPVGDPGVIRDIDTPDDLSRPIVV